MLHSNNFSKYSVWSSKILQNSLDLLVYLNGKFTVLPWPIWRITLIISLSKHRKSMRTDLSKYQRGEEFTHLKDSLDSNRWARKYGNRRNGKLTVLLWRNLKTWIISLSRNLRSSVSTDLCKYRRAEKCTSLKDWKISWISSLSKNFKTSMNMEFCIYRRRNEEFIFLDNHLEHFFSQKFKTFWKYTIFSYRKDWKCHQTKWFILINWCIFNNVIFNNFFFTNPTTFQIHEIRPKLRKNFW